MHKNVDINFFDNQIALNDEFTQITDVNCLDHVLV